MSEREQGADLGILLALAYQEFVRRLRAAHAEAGFTDLGRSDGYVLRALALRPTTVSALADRLGVTKQAAGQIIDDMHRRGYLDRQPDPADRRARLLHLSARGQAALATARRFHHDYESRLVAEHGDAAVSALRGVLQAMAGGEDSVLDPHLRALYL